MEIPKQGRSKEEILAALQEYKGSDLPWRSGKIMAYVYDPGREAEEVAKAAYMDFLSENALDPTTYPSVARLEREVVRMIITLLRGDADCVGNLTSGGTESNLLAIKAARDWARANRPEIAQPEMIISRTAHPSFHKAAVYFDVKPVVVGFDPETFKADVDAMRAAITPNTILLAGSAPGYAQGVVDPIPEIAALAQEHGLLCHVDGCVGGIHLSFMRKLGYDVPPFDFTVPGVTSISADMHKFGYAPKNASVVMFRNRDLRQHAIFACTRTTTYVLINPTLLSTKSGAPMAGSWAILNYLGEEGYCKIVKQVMDATQRLIAAVNEMPDLRVLGKPDMCMFSMASDTLNVFQLADEVSSRGWYIQPQLSTDLSPSNVHITMNQSSVDQVDGLIEVLKASIEAVKQNPVPLDVTAIRQGLEQVLQDMSPESFQQALALAGLKAGEIPKGLALINAVLEALGDDAAEKLLVAFMNDLYV